MECLHHQQQLEQQQYESLVEHCDYIAHTIRKALLRAPADDDIIGVVSGVKNDAYGDKLFSSTKTIRVVGLNGKHYKITVEAV